MQGLNYENYIRLFNQNGTLVMVGLKFGTLIQEKQNAFMILLGVDGIVMTLVKI